MSIVDKTLQRLDGGNNPAPLAEPVAAPLHTVERDLLYVAGARKRRSPWALRLALLLLAMAGLVYFGLQQLAPPAAPVPQLPAQAGHAIEPPRPVLGVAAPEPVAPVLAGAPAAPAIVAPAAPNPVPLATPAPATAPLPSPVPATQAPAAATASAPSSALPQLPWLQRGWEVAQAEGVQQALTIWEQGALTLPDPQLLIVGHAFLDRHGMNAALARRDPSWAVFAVREAAAARQGQAAQYRVVVLVPPNPPSGLLEAVAAQFGRADRLSAAALKRRISGAEPQAQASQPRVLGAQVATAPPLADTAAPAQRLQLPGPPPVAATASGPVGPATPSSAALAAAVPAQAAPVSAPLAVDPAAAAPPAPPRPDRRDWENRANQARELLRQGAFVLVAEHAEAMTRDFPDRWEPWFWLGTAALSRGQLPVAEQSLDRALALNAGVAQVWIQRGIVAQERGDHSAAARFLTQATSLAPRIPEAHLNLGFSFDALGRSSEAERSFRAFLQLTEGNAVYALQRQHIQDWLARR